MDEKQTPSKSQLEQILNAVFKELRTSKDFEPEIIEALEVLAEEGNLKSVPKVEQTIRIIHRGDHETD